MSDQFNIQPGTVFAGDFRVVRSLNAGGMGAVYEAEQMSTGKPRALKVMLSQLIADPSLRKRFEQEARIASLIESEHVVEVVGAGVDAPSGLPWLAMELLQGEDLGQVVTNRGPLPVPDVLAIFEQLCHAVGAAHRVGVVHRDLKPENIFLAQAHRAGATFMVKVLDFGIAKIVAEASTRQTAAIGSPIWMAPEQADQSPITPGTDVWPLGLIAFYLLTGRPYWKSANDDHATMPQVLKEVLFEPIVPASMRTAELGRSLPPQFDGWFARCVARDPAARFPDATQAGLALAAALGSDAAAPFAPTSAVYMPGLAPASSYAAQPSQYVPGSAPNPGPGFAPTGGTGPAIVTGSPPVGLSGTAGTGVAASYTIGAPPGSPSGGVPIHKPRVPPALVAVVVLGALMVGTVAAGGIYWATKSGTTSATTVAHTTDTSGDSQILADSKRLSAEGKHELSHARLEQLASDSPARQSAEFKALELKWASESLLLADRTTDSSTKRALLSAVAQDPNVDDSLRANARDRLAALDSTPSPTASQAVVPDSPPTHEVRRPSVAQQPSHLSSSPASLPAATSQPAAAAAPTASAQPAAQPPGPPTKTLAELAASTSSADWWTARRIIEPKVLAGTATVEELRLLNQICKDQHDRQCLKVVRNALAGKH